MTPEEKAAIEWQCQQLALRFIDLNDRQQWRDMCALLTEDATFARPTDPDNPVRGRDAILATFEKRPANRITRHVCTNIIVEADSADRATGRLYATLYTGDTDNPGDLGLKANDRRLVGEFCDEYRRTKEGWRIASRSGRIIFTVG